MKPDHLPGAAARLSRSRRALAQPRFLVASMALAVAGCAYLATAQTGSAPVEMKPPSASTSSDKPASLADLPGLIEAYGRSRQKAVSTQGSGSKLMAIGNGQSGYNLIETDLTPTTKSDEREPVYAPGGGTIAYASNGVDANKDGRMDDAINAENKYHIWIMNADGTNQRQITGLNAEDRNRNQRHPSWSPTGTEMVYADGDGDTTQLYVLELTPNGPVTQRRTFFTGNKVSPAWSPSGLSIVFACDANADGNGQPNQFDIFSMPPEGLDEKAAGITRLTGGAADPLGNTTNDTNPSFSALNPSVVYFSSDRAINNGVAAKLNAGRRIWDIDVSSRILTQVSNPLSRAAGQASDEDDYPSASLVSGAVNERVAFQSNSFIDVSDATHDLNIWQLSRSTAPFTPFEEAEPRVFASNYSGNGVFVKNPVTNQNGLAYQNLGAIPAPEGVVVSGQYVYVSNSTDGRVIAYDQVTGNQFTDFAVAKDTVPKASGIITDGQYLYVGSGIGAKDKVAIYRLGLFDGSSQGRTADSAAFSSGEPAAAAVKDGTEGLTFSVGNNNQYIFVSLYNDDKINVYRRDNGVFVRTFTTGDGTTANPLNGPTGLTFGPDLNGDGFDDLYVCSSESDDVLAYAGPNPNNITNKVGDGTVDPGAFITAVVDDDDGARTGLNAPEGIKIVRRVDSPLVNIYVSNFHAPTRTGATGTGNTINRYQINPSALPTPPVANPTDASATYLTFPGGAGIGYFDFNLLARQSLATGNGQPAPTATPAPQTTAYENPGAAQVSTNILSSPNNYDDSGLKAADDVVGEDKDADREPAFSRSALTAQLASRLAFASTRRYAPTPSSNAKDVNGNKAAPSNPYGGDSGTHDIWGSAVQDTTPPTLIPQGTGNQLYPVIAPGTQSPFFAPRNFDEGLVPGGNNPLRVAAVLSDLESGVRTARVVVRQAGKEEFRSQNEFVNEKIRVNLRRETIQNATVMNFGLDVYDDGPIGSGGHERQANAVKGDGIYYCEGFAPVSGTINGDFYFDIVATDQRGNSFTYDNIWGFSTQKFNPPISQVNPRDLFVSDYTVGQNFPSVIGDPRFANMMVPTESYYLTNGGGQGAKEDGTIVGTSSATTFEGVDVWRTLCRGPIPQSVLAAYGPSKVPQIDPAETEPGPDGPFTKLSRNVAASSSYVIWAAPYAGTAFVGPGTIVDTVTQERLKTFMESGGRLLVTGRDIAYALTNGNNESDFLSTELGAKLADEVSTDTITAASTDTSASFVAYDRKYDNKYYDLQVPYHYHPQGEENYGDAALSQSQFGRIGNPEYRGPNNPGSAVGIRMDTITPQPGNGAVLTTAYTVGGAVVGQRIEKTRTSGVKSRAVFFSFGMEAINRRYRVPTEGFPLGALDMRRNVADNIGQYFKTGSISGVAINNSTNEPIPNLLLIVRGNGETYLVRTNQNGQYTVSGLAQGGYRVDIAWVLDGTLANENVAGATTSPAGFVDAEERTPFVSGGANTGNVNLRVFPYATGSLKGSVVTSKKTPLDFKDDLLLDEKAVGMAVLLRSVGRVGTTQNGGRYAQLVRTDAGGKFVFDNVPPGFDMEVVFNPTLQDIPEESGLRGGYTGPTSPNPKVGRRVIADTRRPTVIQAPINSSFTLNDPDPVKYPDPDAGPTPTGPDADVAADSGVPIVVPEGPSVRGIVTFNGAPLAGATVDLLDANGVPLSPARSRASKDDGSFNFGDVAEGTYRLRATTTMSDGLVVTKEIADVKVVQGTDTVQNIALVLSTISGAVKFDGKPVAGATVQLLTNDGKIFTPSRTAQTGSDGRYTLVNVPNGTYRVKAFKDAMSGSKDGVIVNDKNVTLSDIILIDQQLSGLVFIRINGSTTDKPLQGATVELLTSGSKPLVPPITTTSDAKGKYAFDEVPAGTYRVRATYRRDSATSDSFKVEAATATNGPTLRLALQNLQVKVIDSAKKVVSGASVTLKSTTDASFSMVGVTNNSGVFTFNDLIGDKYTVTAIKNNLGETVNVTIVRGEKPALLTIKLAGDISGNSNPTAFNVKGKTYLISLPYEDTNNPTTSDVSETLSRGKTVYRPATVKVKNAFTVAPYSEDGTLNYELQSYDPMTRRYVALNNDSILVRGHGYSLKVVNRGTALKIPTTAKTESLRPLFDTIKTFTIVLHRNPSVFNDPLNGRNLIGFGLNPVTYKSIPWGAPTQIIHPNGESVKSIQAAVDKGWLKDQFTTLDSRGAGTAVTVSASQLKPFGGYFAHTLVDGLKIVLIKPAR